MVWKTICSGALLLEALALALLLFLLEPGYDISGEAYVTFKIFALVYLVASGIGGLILTGWLTIGLALIAVAASILFTVALWREETPVRSLRERLRARLG